MNALKAKTRHTVYCTYRLNGIHSRLALLSFASRGNYSA